MSPDNPVVTADLDALLDQKVGDLTKSETVPEAVYHVRVVKAEIRQPSAETVAKNMREGKESYPYINWDLVVTGASPEEFHGRRLFDIGTLKPGGTFVNRQYLQAMEFADEVTIREALPNVVDRELLVAVTVQPAGKGADGKEYEARNRITKRMPLSA